MNSISIHSECLLYTLRYVLSAVRDHNATLCHTPRMTHAQRELEDLVEMIEDAEAFIQGLQAAVAGPQEGVGEGPH